MSCFNSCMITCALLGSKLLIMGSTGYSKNKYELVNMLNDEQKQAHFKIVKKRGILFMRGIILGCVLAFMIVYLMSSGTTLSQTCLFLSIAILTAHYYYLLMPKSDYLLNHLENKEQINAWLKMYKEMNFKSNLGSILGATAFLFVCKTF
jgi:hypothetical protein